MKRSVIPFVAAGVAATSLSFTAGPATADLAKVTSGSPTGAYSGYSSSGVASPVKVEIFEPTIPIPTVPQAEFDMGYAKVKADSSSTKARASFVWPGDGVGEGLKTFFSQLGLPTSLVENGYPVQVNSQYPSETTKQKNSPFPGTSMTTTSGKGRTRATVGFSNDCDAGDGAGDDSGDPPTDGGLLPGLPSIPLLDNLDDVLGLLGLGRTSTSDSSSGSSGDQSFTDKADSGDSADPGDSGGSDGSTTAADTDACQLPAALSLLVDVNGYVADSQSTSDGSLVSSTSRAALGDVRLLGGIVTMSGITSTVVSSSDGSTGKSQGRADYGTVTIAGQTFGVGPEGYVAQGQPSPIPGLPDDPAAALAALGISVQLPKPVYKAVGDKASGTVEGLIVTIDLKTLKPLLSQIDLGPILAQIPFPPEAAPLKSLLGAIGSLSPKIVLHLGYTTSAVDTVQSIPIPATVPDNDPTGAATEGGGGASGGASAGSGTGGGGGAALAGGSVPPPADSSTTAADTSADAIAPVAANPGLPALFSIPGLLLCAGLGGALLAGNYFRRLGALVLGAGGACPHGLESGLPDLRKVQ
jgi:hypothetical protein